MVYKYHVLGVDYDYIFVDQFVVQGGAKCQMYFTDSGQIVELAEAFFKIGHVGGDFVLRSIQTNAKRAIVFPRKIITVVDPYVLRGVECELVIIPAETTLTFRDKALHGSDKVKTFITLSSGLTYEGDTFPTTMTRRMF